MRQSIQEWTKENFCKTTFKIFEVIRSVLIDHITSNILKAVFHKFYLVHSWIRCLILIWFLLEAILCKTVCAKIKYLKEIFGKLKFFYFEKVSRVFWSVNVLKTDWLQRFMGICNYSLREEYRNTEFFLGRIFPHSNKIRRFIVLISVFSLNSGKYGSEKTPNSAIFHVIIPFSKSFLIKKIKITW